MNKESLKGHSELLILSALAQRPMHGYALSEYLKQHTDETFKFGVGMMYPMLHRLEQKKYIKGEWKQVLGADPSTKLGTGRRVYSLSKQGKKALAAKKKEWTAFSSLVTKMISPAMMNF